MSRAMAILHCAVCLYTATGIANEAITIMDGTALCMDHVGYANDDTVHAALTHKATPTGGRS